MSCQEVTEQLKNENVTGSEVRAPISGILAAKITNVVINAQLKERNKVNERDQRVEVGTQDHSIHVNALHSSNC